MKTPVWLGLVLAATTLVLVGCSKQASVDTATLQNSFKEAPAPMQTSADRVVTAVKSGDYPGALSELQTLANNAKLTPEQQQAVKDAMVQVQKVIADTAGAAKVETTKAVEDLKQAVPK